MVLYFFKRIFNFKNRYPNAGYNNRINYYSNARVSYSNIPTGDVNNDNSQLLTAKRFLMAAVGNESAVCANLIGDDLKNIYIK